MESRNSIESGFDIIQRGMDALKTDLAKKEKRIQQLEEVVALSDLFRQVNSYMGSILDFDSMLDMLGDVLVGAMGVSACAILMEIGEIRQVKEKTTSASCKGRFTLEFFDIASRVMGVTQTSLLVNSLERQSIDGFTKGAMIVFSLHRGGNRYGLIAAYYDQAGMITKQREEFFSLIAGQLGVYFENARLYTQMRESAITDGLTQLRNRAYLETLIKENHYRDAGQIGVFLLDIDHFKKVNDSYGHQMGDEVLRTVGRLLFEEVRRLGGRSFRYGGEELLAVFTDQDPVAVAQCAKTLLVRIRSEVFKTDTGVRFQITASFGVCSDTGGMPLTELIQQADQAMYEAKNTGRNRVVAYRDPVMPNVRMSQQ